MGFSLISIGCLFLFNPTVGLFDFLPDIIGYFLIFYGLRKLSVVYNSFAEAKRSFGVLCFVGAAKLLFSVLDYYVIKDDKAGLTTSLIFVFVFCIAEFVCLVPAFVKLLDSLTYAGSLTGGEAVFKKEKQVKRLTVAFFILRAILPVFPFLTALSNYENLGYVNQGLELNFSVYKRLFTVITVLIIAAVGIWWLITFLLYIKRIRKDNLFIENLNSQFEQKLSETPFVFVRKAIFLSTLLLIIASVFNIDFYVALNDHSVYDEATHAVSSFNYNWGMVNLIPDVASAILYITAFLCGYAVYKKRVLLLISGILYFISTAFAYTSELIFNSEYVMDDVKRSALAEDAYNSVIITNGIKCAAFIFMFAVLTVCLCRLTDEHTGIAPLNPDRFDSRQLIALHNTVKAKLWVAFGVTVLSAGISFAASMKMPYFRPLWSIDLLVTLVQIAVFYYSVSAVRREVHSRYD